MNYPSGKRKFINGVCFDESNGSVTATETYTCDDFKQHDEDIATAFQFGMALGFAEKCGECNDCISRQAALEKAINVPIAKVVTEDKVIYRKVVFADDIEKLPSVTPQPKTGHWIDKNIRGSIEPYCSVCGDSVDTIYHYDYCPNCGIKMESEVSDANSN